MQELDGKVAVVTGAASGIGLGMAERFAAEGMRVVMADVERNALQAAVDELSATGADVIAAPTDTSVFDEVEALAARRSIASARCTWCATTPVSAAVACRSASCRMRDFEWVLGVNLWGVIHGLHAFLPHLPVAGRGSHRQHRVGVGALPPAQHGAVQRVQGRRAGAQRDAQVRARRRGLARRRVGAVPELGAHQHLHRVTQPARASRLRADQPSRWPRSPSTRTAASSSW